MKIKIQLFDKNRVNVEWIEIEPSILADNTILVYKDKYYVYRSLSGIRFDGVQYQEVEKPFLIE